MRRNLTLIHEHLPYIDQQRSVLEVGSGSGGETAVLRELYGEGNIVAIDRDPRAAVPSERQGVEFIPGDILTFPFDSLEELVQEKRISCIIAMRTSPRVADYILQFFDYSGLVELLIFSLIEESDIARYHQNTAKRDGRIIPLREMRGTLETVFLINRREQFSATNNELYT